MKPLLLLLLFALPLTAKPREWQDGKLIDVRSHETGNGALRAQNGYCLAVEVGQVDFLLEYEPYGRGSYQPSDLVVGDTVKVNIDGNNMHLTKPSGGEFKAHIVRRERVSDKGPVSCALPVTSR